MKNGVELLGEARSEVVTHPFGLRSIDNPNRALEPRIAQGLSGLSLSQQKKEPTYPRVVEQPLITASHRGPHSLALRRLIPVRGGCDCAGMGSESHEKRAGAVCVPYELAEIE